MAKLFRRNIRAVDQLNGNGSKVFQNFLTCCARKYLGNILTYLDIPVRTTLNTVYSNINLVAQWAYLAVVVPVAALTQLSVYAVLRHESSSLAHQIS